MKVGFIGIGAQKSATTWLHHLLMEHPNVELGHEKELNYFTANFDRGALWYERQFPEYRARTIRGENSPTYFFSRDAPVRAKQYNPDLKLIAVLRDPITRAYSNHLHEIRKEHIPSSTSFETALQRNPAYIEQGQYRTNLSRWLEQFDRSQLLILLAEEIGSDPTSAYNSVCSHLGIPTLETGPELFERQHESIRYNNTGLQKAIRRGGDALRALGLGTALRSFKRNQTVHRLLSLNATHLKSEVAPMKEETRAMLRETFEPDAQYVIKLTGRSDLPWFTLSTAEEPANGDRTSKVQHAE